MAVVQITHNKDDSITCLHEPGDGFDTRLIVSAHYAIGITPPNYPVPAIRQWFEFCYRRGPYKPGRDLFDESVELVHCVQDRFTP